MKELGARVKQLRLKHNLSLEELANRLKLNRSSLSRIENGVTYPRADTLERMSEYFDVPSSYFYGSEVTIEDVATTVEIKNRVSQLGIEWIALGEKMKERGLTPDELESIVKFLEVQKKLHAKD